MPWWPLCTRYTLRVTTRRQRAAFCAFSSVLQPALMQRARLQLLQSMAGNYCEEHQPKVSQSSAVIDDSPTLMKTNARPVSVAPNASHCCQGLQTLMLFKSSLRSKLLTRRFAFKILYGALSSADKPLLLPLQVCSDSSSREKPSSQSSATLHGESCRVELL